MKFAVIGDIHSNKYALESVLSDIDAKDIDFIVSTGDLVGYLPFVNEVIDMVRANGVLVVQGNHDKHIADSKPVNDDMISMMSEEQIQSNASSAYTNWIISYENRRYLKNLPSQLSFDCKGLKIIITHGSHRKIDEYLYEDKEKLAQLTKTLEADILICGHTHIPYHATVDEKHFINAGSVGKPKHGGAEATYAMINVEDSEISSEIVKVDYDVDAMTKAIEENKMISNKLIPMLKDGY